MNWKLIFQLSLFGLAMAVATVYWIPGNTEMFFWLPIFLICAYLIAKNCSSNYFLHGFMVSIFNCVYITAAHIIFYDTYITGHAEEADMYNKMNVSLAPQVMMVFVGPVFGIIFGLILGLFSFIASKLAKR